MKLIGIRIDEYCELGSVVIRVHMVRKVVSFFRGIVVGQYLISYILPALGRHFSYPSLARWP